jgi:hypothetical protein
MNKILTEAQIQQIENTLVQVNVPVQVFIGIQKLFKELPEVEKQEKK